LTPGLDLKNQARIIFTDRRSVNPISLKIAVSLIYLCGIPLSRRKSIFFSRYR